MSDHVMVFAPAPVLSVTIEQQADVLELHLHAGGQGIWQARMISSLGARVVLCAAVGGEVGAVLSKVLDDEDIELRMVPRQSSSGWYVHDRRDGSREEVAENPGAPLVRHDLDELYGIALAEGMRADVAVLSGPAHPDVVDDDVYRRLASDLRGNGAQVVADLSGGQLAAVLAGGVSFLKVSHEEVIDAGRAADDSVDALVRAAHQLRSDGAEAVLISRAEKSALALIDDDVVEVRVPQLEMVDHRGAGDSMTAGVSAVLARGGSLDEAIRTGAAAGAVNVTRHGLGTGRAEAVRELIGRVELTPLK
ncbi:1-phosphofructokinase family hexose kinase [Micromonospora sp. NBC_01813]|uniref:1-phosphofructokinase family hexose kinase n=1 Tax=Micromonospora sp. NBC_01813 TaxID=2975988 RepID=UPI002DD95C57|nr:PfkB family carbohydrate kinase [Micromonospora sp. NBC_01813]WSA11220.1 PfkB family carbohydrate kinase [Micromonospora sp. NBC_01813]